MVEQIQVSCGWNPNVKKYQASVMVMRAAEMKTFTREDGTTYLGSKSGIEKLHFETDTLKELAEKLGKLED